MTVLGEGENRQEPFGEAELAVRDRHAGEIPAPIFLTSGDRDRGSEDPDVRVTRIELELDWSLGGAGLDDRLVHAEVAIPLGVDAPAATGRVAGPESQAVWRGGLSVHAAAPCVRIGNSLILPSKRLPVTVCTCGQGCAQLGKRGINCVHPCAQCVLMYSSIGAAPTRPS